MSAPAPVKKTQDPIFPSAFSVPSVKKTNGLVKHLKVQVPPKGSLPLIQVIPVNHFQAPPPVQFAQPVFMPTQPVPDWNRLALTISEVTQAGSGMDPDAAIELLEFAINRIPLYSPIRSEFILRLAQAYAAVKDLNCAIGLLERELPSVTGAQLRTSFYEQLAICLKERNFPGDLVVAIRYLQQSIFEEIARLQACLEAFSSNRLLQKFHQKTMGS